MDFKNIIIVVLLNALVLIGGLAGGYYLSSNHKSECHCSEPAQALIGRKYHPIHAILFHVVACDLTSNQRPKLIEQLLDNDKFSAAAVNAVEQYAANHKTDLAKLTPNQLFQWIWEHRQDLIRLLLELLPLFINQPAPGTGIGAVGPTN